MVFDKAGERLAEALLRVDHLQPDAQGIAVIIKDVFALVFPQQAVVDQKAGQPIPQRPVRQRRGDAAFQAAGDLTDRGPAADSMLHVASDGVDKAAFAVVHGAGADILGKLKQDAHAVRIIAFGLKAKAEQGQRRVGKPDHLLLRVGDGHKLAVQFQRGQAVKVPLAVMKALGHSAW